MSAESKIVELGLKLPPAPTPKGAYKPLAKCGNLVFASGHLPIDESGNLVVGRLGEGLDAAAGYQAARLAALGILASLRKEFGSLDRIKQVVKVFGVVNCTADFVQQPAVLNGCSELFAEVFGQSAGIAARSAIGANSLPLGAAVEVEAVFEI
jgi:enamine deaminase RidA (YjgF/YER057c/UK114 family)